MRMLGVAVLVVAMLAGDAHGTDPENNSKADSGGERQQSKMDTHGFLQRMVGKWKGNYSLWLTPKSDSQDSTATAEIRSVAAGRFLLFTYAWEQGGKNQEGVFLLGGDKDSASATWGDSFHMASEPMVCQGSLQDEGNKLVLDGHYSGGGAEWGWRTELVLKDATTLVMQAFNITPDGQEALAVRCEMERAADQD